MSHTSSVPLSAPSYVFVESYPDLVYQQFRDGALLPGGQQLHLDLLKPVSTPPTPLVVFIKGGGFRNVHRARYTPALVRLAERGIAVASVEYRTSNLVRFPGPLDDVRSALRYLRAHASEFNIDPRAVALWGNSAGATIATIVGATAAADERVRAVASWYGIHDPSITRASEAHSSPLRTALGPDRDKWFRPGDHITPEAPPTFLLHGTADRVVPVEQSLSLARTLEEHGVEHELMLVEGGQHSFAEMSTRTNALERTFNFVHGHLADPVSANNARD